MRHREVRKLAQVAQPGRENLGFKLRLGTRQTKLPVPLFCTPAPAQSLPFLLAGIWQPGQDMVCPSAHLFQETNTALWPHVSRNHPSLGTDTLPDLPLDGQLLHTGVGSFGEKQCLAHRRHPNIFVEWMNHWKNLRSPEPSCQQQVQQWITPELRWVGSPLLWLVVSWIDGKASLLSWFGRGTWWRISFLKFDA